MPGEVQEGEPGDDQRDREPLDAIWHEESDLGRGVGGGYSPDVMMSNEYLLSRVSEYERMNAWMSE